MQSPLHAARSPPALSLLPWHHRIFGLPSPIDSGDARAHCVSCDLSYVDQRLERDREKGERAKRHGSGRCNLPE